MEPSSPSRKHSLVEKFSRMRSNSTSPLRSPNKGRRSLMPRARVPSFLRSAKDSSSNSTGSLNDDQLSIWDRPDAVVFENPLFQVDLSDGGICAEPPHLGGTVIHEVETDISPSWDRETARIRPIEFTVAADEKSPPPPDHTGCIKQLLQLSSLVKQRMSEQQRLSNLLEWDVSEVEAGELESRLEELRGKAGLGPLCKELKVYKTMMETEVQLRREISLSLNSLLSSQLAALAEGSKKQNKNCAPKASGNGDSPRAEPPGGAPAKDDSMRSRSKSVRRRISKLLKPRNPASPLTSNDGEDETTVATESTGPIEEDASEDVREVLPPLDNGERSRRMNLARECGFCGHCRVGSMQCTSCKLVYYCDQDCQRNDWDSHKPMCQG